ncbi:hypothetical protein EOM39_01385 [Candidatus Gracilibacteria bacterium]|nr:hypothetical protein [Candidatus Gracilibacteria bacterium]
MRIFDEKKENELVLENLDLSKGYLKQDKLFLKKHKAIKEQTEIKEEYVIYEYPNGGKDIGYKIIQPYIAPKDAWDEYEDIQVYIPYTEKELAEKEIIELKAKLQDSDYKASRFAEGSLTAEEYEKTKQDRIAWRLRIQELSKKIRG